MKIRLGKTFVLVKKIFVISYKMDRKFFLILLFTNIIQVILPILIMFNTQNIINGIQLKIGFYSHRFLFLILLFLVLNLLSEINSSVSNYVSLRYKDTLDYKYSELQLEKINKQSLSEFENPGFYDLIQRAESAGGTFPFNIMNNIISICVQLLSSISYIYILVTWKWWTLFIIIIFPLLSSYQIAKISKDEYKLIYSRAKSERQSWYYAHLLNKDINIKETRLFSLEDYFLNKFKVIKSRFINENKKMYFRRNRQTFFVQAVSIMSSSVIVATVFFDACVGKILLGSLMTYISSINSVKASIGLIISTFFQIHQNSLYANNIIALLEYKNDKFVRDENVTKKIAITSIESIEFKNVTFRYKNNYEKMALKNVNLKLSIGNNYVLVGRNGSGKSTLIKLLLGFYEDYEGNILINGIDLHLIDIEKFRKCLTAVFQDFTNFQFTVSEAVSVSEHEVKDIKRIKDSIINSNAIDFVSKLPEKLDQQIGNWFDNGIQLSGGELQKLAIARSFYKTSASVVVLDEPSASLDSISESKVYESFSKLTQGKIGIFITHKLNINFSGNIIVLNNGEIEELGTHSQLMNNKGLYSKLYTTQNNIIAKNC